MLYPDNSIIWQPSGTKTILMQRVFAVTLLFKLEKYE